MYYLSNSLFSPTYDDTIFFICFYCNNTPVPYPSTPQLFDTIVKSFYFCFANAATKFSGRPHNPNPPITNVIPSFMSFVASSADLNIFDAKLLLYVISFIIFFYSIILIIKIYLLIYIHSTRLRHPECMNLS